MRLAAFVCLSVCLSVSKINLLKKACIPIPIRGMQGFTALQPRRPRPPSGSKGHPQKDSYYLGTKVL